MKPCILGIFLLQFCFRHICLGIFVLINIYRHIHVILEGGSDFLSKLSLLFMSYRVFKKINLHVCAYINYLFLLLVKDIITKLLQLTIKFIQKC